MEVYIDDMLVKSVKVELHITYIAEAFQVLKSYNMKLNQMRLRSLRREVLGFYSQQPRNRSKPRQDKGRAQYAATFKH